MFLWGICLRLILLSVGYVYGLCCCVACSLLGLLRFVFDCCGLIVGLDLM